MEYLSLVEEQQVVTAIAAAERGNHGEVRVHLERRCPAAPLERARQLFLELGLDRTRDGTGVLLYVALRDRRAAVYSGPGIFGARAPDFWQGVVDLVAQGFGRAEGAGGLVAALGAVGELLREQVPGDDTAGNELADRVSMG